jgi:alpha-mannosidase
MIGKMMNKAKLGTIHCIGNAHIDPVWLWRWQEGYQETRATFRSALDRMKEFPEFVFSASQAAVYKWIEESEPEMFAEIQERVKEGRWVLVNGWWMEPDCNIPSGESFARQSLYGQSYFKEKFGQICSSGYCVDSFGHNSMLPQLLIQGGFKYYVFMRPNKFENPACPDGPFRWISADGSEVLAYRLISAYGSGPEDVTPEAINKISSFFTENIQDEMFFYGVGDHGGGPTIANIRSIQAMQQNETLPELVFSSPDRYFTTLIQRSPDAVEKLPVYRGELQIHAVGCYAVQCGVKKWNRKAENALIQAERWSAISFGIAQTPYPGTALKEAWQTVLFNQFHDILAGSSIREAYEDSRDDFGSAFQTAGIHTNRALQRISKQVDTQGGETAILVYNPHAFPITIPVEHELMTWHLGGKPLTLVDDLGKAVSWQPGPLSATVPAGWRMRLCFLADLPSLGYRVYHLNANPEEPSQEVGFRIEQISDKTVNGYETAADGRVDWVVENALLHLEFDGHTGALNHLLDRRSGHEVLSGPAARGLVLLDPSDTWSHGVDSYREESGSFGDAEIRAIEAGSERAVVRIKSYYRQSTLLQDFILYKDLPWIEVRTVVDWHEKHKIFKLAFPVQVEAPLASYEIPYGVLERPVNGREVPGQRWFDVSGMTTQGKYGLSIINDSKYSFDVLDHEMRMTVLRSPVYAHHVPQKLENGDDYIYMDQGRQEFTYILLPHCGSWQESEVVHLADILNMAPTCLTEGIHSGILPKMNSFLSIQEKNIEISVLKIAEEGKDLVLRCRETTGKGSSSKIQIPYLSREFTVTLTPWQIKTIRIPWDKQKTVQETNFLEE